MDACHEIERALGLVGCPIRFVRPSHDGEWIEAEFGLPGGTVTLALPPGRATAGEFAHLFDMAIRSKEAE